MGRAIFSISNEFWSTDGTAAGTRKLSVDLSEILPDFAVLGGKALSVNGDDLIITDLTPAGTRELKIPGLASGTDFTRLGSEVLFLGIDASRHDNLWVTDGTAARTKELKVPGAASFDTNPADITVLGSKAIFWGHSTNFNRDIWVTDGTSAGTYDYAGFLNVGPDPAFTVLGNKALFQVTALSGASFLWATDGTFAGTKFPTASVPGPGSALSDMVVLGRKALFVSIGNGANGHSSLWTTLSVTDGTVAGTHGLNVRHASTLGLFAFNDSPSFQRLGTKVLFAGSGDDSELNQRDLWVTDGTSAGTTELHAANANPQGLLTEVDPDFTVLGNKVLFAGWGKDGINLWVTDGTSKGTKELANVGPFEEMFPTNITVVGSKAVFSATDKDGSTDVWVTDGTSKGTKVLLSTGVDDSEIAIAGLPPAAPRPSQPTLAAGSDSGVKGDRITNFTKPTIAGKGQAGDTLTLLDGAKVIGSAVVGKSGDWAATPRTALAPGVHSLTATEAGASTWASVPSAALKVTIKNSSPAPSGLGFSVAADKGAAGDSFRITGRGEAGDRVALLDGGAAIGGGTVGSGGVWSITTAKPLAIGTHFLSVNATDVAGNVSPRSPTDGLLSRVRRQIRCRFSARPASTISPAVPATMCSAFRPPSSAIPTSPKASGATTSWC